MPPGPCRTWPVGILGLGSLRARSTPFTHTTYSLRRREAVRDTSGATLCGSQMTWREGRRGDGGSDMVAVVAAVV